MRYYVVLALAFVIYMANALFLAFFYYDYEWLRSCTWLADHLWQVVLPLYVGLETKYRKVKVIAYYWAIFAFFRFLYTTLTYSLKLPLISERYSYLFIHWVFIVTLVYLVIVNFNKKN